ncbi:DUF1771-domain-containing protein [Phlebopus sp. FC_14]|nr:DUF1771-domain-containing protein [Phlebopus sp. FC_14]
MAGLMDILLAIVKTLCGGSTPPEAAYEKPLPPLPQHPAPLSTRPQEQRPATGEKPEYRRKTHEQAPPPKPAFESPGRQQSPPPQQAHKRHQGQNQINQHNEHYVALRAKANEEGDLMAQSFQQSHEAYERRDGALAKQLSEKGKQHQRTMEKLNAEASTWIFRENNLDSQPGDVDLHGLYVKEAVLYSEKAIQEARGRGDSEIRLIVGKGLHSDGHIAKIKPALEDLMKKHNLPAEVDPHNAGVLIVRLR